VRKEMTTITLSLLSFLKSIFSFTWSEKDSKGETTGNKIACEVTIDSEESVVIEHAQESIRRLTALYLRNLKKKDKNAFDLLYKSGLKISLSDLHKRSGRTIVVKLSKKETLDTMTESEIKEYLANRNKTQGKK
jgi:hypothetical protein